MPLMLVTRGAKHGQCNICGDIGPLTEDHTPPKGCARPTSMELQHVTARVDAAKAIKLKANDGVKYRTLCARCNNLLLGARYDPALIDFVNRVSAYLSSDIALPPTMTVSAQPALVIRAVWGHLAAVGVDRYLKGSDTDALRDYFLDDTQPSPSEMKLYYWLYPYRRQVLIRDAALGDLQQRWQATYWAMKFYPMAFAVWYPAKGNATLPMRDLAYYVTPNAADYADVAIDLRPAPHELTLEAPTDAQVILFGQDSIVANSRAPRGRIIGI